VKLSLKNLTFPGNNIGSIQENNTSLGGGGDDGDDDGDIVGFGVV
jgi:hypothetical protein